MEAKWRSVVRGTSRAIEANTILRGKRVKIPGRTVHTGVRLSAIERFACEIEGIERHQWPTVICGFESFTL